MSRRATRALPEGKLQTTNQELTSHFA
ncbi:hypothetical protein RSAG8_13910, partial [Rhizoctonia solani AG-8 WAC10335]